MRSTCRPETMRVREGDAFAVRRPGRAADDIAHEQFVEGKFLYVGLAAAGDLQWIGDGLGLVLILRQKGCDH